MTAVLLVILEGENLTGVASSFSRKDVAAAELAVDSSNSFTGSPAAALDQNQGNQRAGRPNRPADTDETVAVSKGTRLSVNNFAGEVQVRTWDRDAVRVQAFHGRRSSVSIKPGSGVLVVTSSGMSAAIDYDISVPAWMPIKIEGTYLYVAVEGTQADVTAETVRGDISIKGGSSMVTAKSVEGEIILDGVRGKVNASSINQGVTVNGASGELSVETVNGPITLNNIESSTVDVSSVNGNLKYDGNTAANGRYRFTTHNGNISVGVPENGSAAFIVRIYNGSVRSDLQLQGGAEARRGQRITYTLGSGSAEFELESFGGTIQLRRRGSDGPLKRLKDKEQ
jgi:hypothetical protein